ncbi:ABC transporter substrate-binding protein [Streptomyces abyssalis]|uniref:ABC transporter substrate-binding protein n=1 Tax=Streptomyces abyssalis TaxID=933944 RepID=A0A1E7JI56_9ACTN|nr:ABC transporter substrate-binding protein [Streptomyces abyssalis]OEU86137.1 ABC transporter substrate-binding protein [Streptomyces abyssalis]OEU92397.1 ABC transporter substrate-binding protein [Streptomyces abyssalis]OEV29180.1 ABC transporter substrate-binding protein [Streptomyces nanshensis]
MHQRPRVLGAFGVVLALALALTGCGGPGQGDGTGTGGEPRARSAADRAEPLSGPAPEPELPARVTSADGHRVTVRDARRIVPLSGSLSEIVYSLGLGKRVVARDITATFAQARKLPVVTRAHDVSAESVLSLKPSVVLAETTTGPAEAVDQIREAGIPLVVLGPAQDLGDVGTRIAAVAKALGVDDAGDRLRERTDKRIDAVRDDLPGGDRPRVAFLYLRGSASVYLLGGARSGASSLIEAAGGVDAGEESGIEKDFTAITSEALAKAAPDVILVMSKGLESVDGVDGLLKIPGVAETPAGADRRVAAIDDGILLNYGPRTDEVLKDLSRQIHNGGAK